jgi:hypothetical protein
MYLILHVTFEESGSPKQVRLEAPTRVRLESILIKIECAVHRFGF